MSILVCVCMCVSATLKGWFYAHFADETGYRPVGPLFSLIQQKSIETRFQLHVCGSGLKHLAPLLLCTQKTYLISSLSVLLSFVFSLYFNHSVFSILVSALSF